MKFNLLSPSFLILFYEPISSVLVFNVTDEQATDSLPYKLKISKVQ